MGAKVSKESVAYAPGIRTRRCVLCTMFEAPHACSLVAGWISPSAVCDRFERKKE